MRNVVFGVPLMLLLAMPWRCAAQGASPSTRQTTPGVARALHIEKELSELPPGALAHIDTKSPQIFDASDARAILDATLVRATASTDSKALPDSKDFYCIIHLLKWNITDNADPQKQSAAGKQADKQADPASTDKWYVYHAGRWSRDDFSVNNRVFGTRRIWLVFIHLDRPQAAYVARYQLDVTKKTPAILSNLAGLAQMFFDKGGSGSPHGWGGGYVDIDDVPSDVTITPLKVTRTPGISNEYSKLAEPKTFDNEGRYWIDFSVGVPIRSGKELTVDTANTTVSPRKVDKQRIFALINLFPQPVDVKSFGFNRAPHFVAGVAIASQPLHQILLAAGWGPAFANFYIGTLIVTQPEVPGVSARKHEAQFTFGVNLTVKGTQDALKKAQK